MAQHAWKEAREVSARRHARPGFAARSAMNRPERNRGTMPRGWRRIMPSAAPSGLTG